MPSTYTPSATTTLGSAAASVTFSSISGAYTDLILVCNTMRTTGLDNIGVRFNSDTATNYSWTILKGNGTAASSDRRSSVTDIIFNVYNNDASTPAVGILQLQNYSNTTTYKTALSRSSAAAAGYVYSTVGLWRSTSAIMAASAA